MKKILYLFTICFFAALSCQEPQYIEPDIQRQGITSLTAFFTSTSPQYEDKELATLYVDDPDAEVFEIPVPWFYPEHTTDATTLHMTRVRLKAELAPNCRIEPPLQIVDLTRQNEYTFINAQGEGRRIIITGKRTKSDKCNLMSFSLTNPYQVDCFIDDDKNEISIYTIDDLKNFSASATPCAHATVETNLAQKKNYNNEQSVTVVAQDGKTKRTYKIVKKFPTMIPYGFRTKSVRQLFNLDANAFLGIPAFTDELLSPSLGYVGGYLVACLGNGSTPMYIDPLTGVKKGNITLGSAPAAAITSDEGGNLLLTNHAEAGENVEIYRTNAVDKAPELFHSFTNATDVAVGYYVKVHGNIDADAVIILTHEGVSGVTSTSKYTRVVISGGEIISTETVDLIGTGIAWGAADGHCAKVVSASNTTDKGVMMAYYTPFTADAGVYNLLKYVNGEGAIEASLPLFSDDVSSNYNSPVMDVKTYNNATYLAHLVTSWFPEWDCGPELKIFDVTNPNSFKDGNTVITKSIKYDLPGGHENSYSAGDVIIAPSADGFKVYVFYFDHHAGIIGGYIADSIDI